MDELQASLPAFERQLLRDGYGLYSIDYTRDFSGVLDRETLVEHLCAFEGFREQGDLAAAMRADTPTILANTDSVGSTSAPGSAQAMPATQCARSSTTRSYRISKRARSESQSAAIWPTMSTARYGRPSCTQKCRPEDAPGSKSLSTPAAGGTSRPTLLPRWWKRPWPWYPPKICRKKKASSWSSHRPSSRRTWPHASTGALCWPTDHRARSLWPDKEGVELAPLRCYTKDADASTILAASKRPTQLHSDGPDPETLLPPSATVSWVWRTTKCHAVGKDVSAFYLHEVPKIAEGRAISTLSTRNRENRLLEIRDAANAEAWKRRAWARLEAEQRHHEEQQRRRAEELAKLAELAGEHKRYAERSQETARDVEEALGAGGTEKVADVAGRRWTALGFRRMGAAPGQYNKHPRVVLQAAPVPQEAGGLETDADTRVVWATHTKYKYKRTTYWLPPIGAGRFAGLEIEIEPTRVFRSRDGRQISWNPIRVVAAPDPRRLATLQALAAKAQEHQATEAAHQETEQRATLLEAPAPKPKDTTKAIDLAPGEYICRRYASTTFRSAPRTLLFLVPARENGEPTTDVETPTYGHFLEREVEALGGIQALRKAHAPLLCNLGAERTTPQKKKDRLAALAMSQATAAV
ncbi:predicted protein [Nematostella vectensis]|uniref:Uncharacterized protein n=1 Tax=Nematostella vectensis TaxID=45351 RepID=A7RGR8_NEMVE|nr:predicted protein [Nematostella vectensis]|eukprot:XP_001641521.1 predicted protein [Nematostella vectensis]